MLAGLLVAVGGMATAGAGVSVGVVVEVRAWQDNAGTIHTINNKNKERRMRKSPIYNGTPPSWWLLPARSWRSVGIISRVEFVFHTRQVIKCEVK
jgi:hypothetical protein